MTGDKHSLGDLPVGETLGDEVRMASPVSVGATQDRAIRSARFTLEMHDQGRHAARQ